MKQLFLCTLILLSPLAWADKECEYDIGLGNFTATIQDLPQVLSHPITLSRGQNSSEANCPNYRLYFGKGNANSYQRRAYNGSESITYNLYRTVSLGNVLKDFGDAGTGEFVFGSAPVKFTTYTNQWFVEVISKDQLFNNTSGIYTDVVPVHLYVVRENGNLQFEETRVMTLTFSLPRFAELSIVPEGSPHNPSATTYVMDFGTIESGEELRADLLVKANAGYTIHMSSTNGGVLRNMPNAGSTVPYQVRAGNSGWITPTTSPVQIQQENSGTNSNGRRYNLRVRLGNVTNLTDGNYEDVVTLTVTAI